MPDLRAMQVSIRPAEAHDVPAMLALVKELAVFEKEPDAVTVTVEEMCDAGFGPKPVWFGWIAFRSGDQMIGRSDDGSRSSDPLIDTSSDWEGIPSSDHLIDTSSDPILGIAICYERYSTWKGRCLYLEDIVVTKTARGQGIGDMLFRACVKHAAAEGYHWMRWQVLDWNTGAIRFYERLGATVSTGWLNGDLDREQIGILAKSI